MSRYFLLIFLLNSSLGFAQTSDGDYFREYYWLPQDELKTQTFLRVGGKLDYAKNEEFKQNGIVNEDNTLGLPFDLDLKGAKKAELVLEKIQSHEGTQGLKLSINGNDFLKVPELKIESEVRAIDFMQQYYPIVEIPLNHIKKSGNRIKMVVDSIQNWGWPQNIFYGLILRVYYEKMDSDRWQFEVRQPNDSTVSISSKFEGKVDYLFKGEDVNWEGDGVYNQWHYHFHRTNVTHHIGTGKKGIVWNTAWIPDQKNVEIGARIHLKDGSIVFKEIGKIDISHQKYEIKLLKPYDIPAFWSTRSGEFTEKFDFKGDLDKIHKAKLYWTSWSPCYSNGVLLNGHLVTDGKGPCYDYFAHEVDISNVHVFEQGENKITTLLTPLFQGQMVHGMEVQYPGIMVKVKMER